MKYRMSPDEEFQTAVACLSEDGKVQKIISATREWTNDQWRAVYGDDLPKRKLWPTLDLQTSHREARYAVPVDRFPPQPLPKP